MNIIHFVKRYAFTVVIGTFFGWNVSAWDREEKENTYCYVQHNFSESFNKIKNIENQMTNVIHTTLPKFGFVRSTSGKKSFDMKKYGYHSTLCYASSSLSAHHFDCLSMESVLERHPHLKKILYKLTENSFGKKENSQKVPLFKKMAMFYALLFHWIARKNGGELSYKLSSLKARGGGDFPCKILGFFSSQGKDKQDLFLTLGDQKISTEIHVTLGTVATGDGNPPTVSQCKKFDSGLKGLPVGKVDWRIHFIRDKKMSPVTCNIPDQWGKKNEFTFIGEDIDNLIEEGERKIVISSKEGPLEKTNAKTNAKTNEKTNEKSEKEVGESTVKDIDREAYKAARKAKKAERIKKDKEEARKAKEVAAAEGENAQPKKKASADAQDTQKTEIVKIAEDQKVSQEGDSSGTGTDAGTDADKVEARISRDEPSEDKSSGAGQEGAQKDEPKTWSGFFQKGKGVIKNVFSRLLG